MKVVVELQIPKTMKLYGSKKKKKNNRKKS